MYRIQRTNLIESSDTADVKTSVSSGGFFRTEEFAIKAIKAIVELRKKYGYKVAILEPLRAVLIHDTLSTVEVKAVEYNDPKQ